MSHTRKPHTPFALVLTVILPLECNGLPHTAMRKGYPLEWAPFKHPLPYLFCRVWSGLASTRATP